MADDECARCGVVFAKAAAGSAPPRDLRIAIQYARRAKQYNRVAKIIWPMLAAAFLFGALDQSGLATALVVLPFLIIVPLAWMLLRCPHCDCSIGDPDRSFCPRCGVLLRPLRVQHRVDLAIAGEFLRRRTRMSARQARDVVIFCGVLVGFAVLAKVGTPEWLDKIGGYLVMVLVVAGIVWGFREKHDYTCPACNKPLFEYTSDNLAPMLDIEFCPFCGVRFEG